MDIYFKTVFVSILIRAELFSEEQLFILKKSGKLVYI